MDLESNNSKDSFQNEASDKDMDEVEEEEEIEEEKPKSKKKPGIVYLSSIPLGMNPQLVRKFLGEHGELGKSFLQPIESMFYFMLNLLIFFKKKFSYRTWREKKKVNKVFWGLGRVSE